MITEWLRISAVHAMCRRSADALDFDPGGHFDCNADGVAIKMLLRPGPGDVIKMPPRPGPGDVIKMPPRPGPGDLIKMTRPPARYVFPLLWTDFRPCIVQFVMFFVVSLTSSLVSVCYVERCVLLHSMFHMLCGHGCFLLTRTILDVV